MTEPKRGFVARHLSPGERAGEVLFGLIMTLTFTLGAAAVIGEGEDATRELLIATIGCNVAWGIIDGVLIILGRIFERSSAVRLGQAIRKSAGDEEAMAAVASELDDRLEPLTSPGIRESLYRDVVSRVRGAMPQRAGIRGVDWLAAFAAFWLVFFASLPAAIPFMIMDDPWMALRVSNGLLIGLLFFAGFKWAGYTSLNPWLAGFSVTAIGVVLVVAAIALGG